MYTDHIFSSELVILVVAAIMLVLMLTTKPKHSPIYHIDLIGMILGIVMLIDELAIGIIAGYSYSLYSKPLFDALCIIFLILYVFNVGFIVLYIILLNLLHVGKRKNRLANNLIFGFCILIYAAVCVVLVRNGYLYKFNGNEFNFSNFVRFYTLIGIIASITAFVATIMYRHRTAKVITHFSLFFVPIDLMVLLLQAFLPQQIFSGATYILPFVIFYILFHSNAYDEATGCKNRGAYENYMNQLIKKKRKKALIYIEIPQVENVDFFSYLGSQEEANVLFSETCRKLENEIFACQLFHPSVSTFVLAVRRGDKYEKAFEIVQKNLEEVCDKVNAVVYYHLIGIEHFTQVSSYQMLRSYIHFLKSKFESGTKRLAYKATEEDLAELKRRYVVQQALLDIRNQNDLNDERVCCYLQPIYSVEDKCFKTAESLMRLEINGEMYYPDVFIPIAEQNNCIHTLTLVILNKICKYLKNLPEDYAIDAVTVNCSSLEFTDKGFAADVLRVIEANGVSSSQIRLELTESAMIDNFEVLQMNLSTLMEAGVKFYLDDFGTGYSNLERILSLPFHTVKFDKSLLYKAIGSKMVEDLLSGMVHVFKNNGFTVLVEGVEDESQCDFCISHGFEYIQGYKFARPTPIEQVNEYFKK